MRTVTYLTGIVALLGSVAAVKAEIYATGTLAFSGIGLQGTPPGVVDNDPDDEPAEYSGGHINGSLGYISDSGFYGQVDLRFTQNSRPFADNHYEEGRFAALRLGKAFNDFSVGAFAGVVETDADNDTTNEVNRALVGVEGAYAFRNGLGVYAQIGRIGGAKGNHGINGSEGLFDANFHILGLTYSLDENVGLRGYVGQASGRMDADGDAADIDTFGIEATLNLGNGLSTFFAVEQNKYFQNEVGGKEIKQDSVAIGLSYDFNKQSRTRTHLQPLPNIENWLGITGGPLEGF